MKLVKTTFDELDIGDECIFRNYRGYVIHCNKIDKTKIRVISNYMPRITEFNTGAYHEVYKIEDGHFGKGRLDKK